MNDDKLIEIVRQYPVIYDLYHPKYMDTNFKNNIWNKIGSQLEAESAVCKSRWANIRDTFRKSLKKSVTKIGAKKIKTYKYSEQLSFLIKYFDEKIHQEAQQDDDGQTHDDLIVPADSEDSVSSHFLGNQPCSTSDQKEGSSLPEKRRRLAAITETQPTKSNKVIEYIIANSDNEGLSVSQLPLVQHSVDAFLAGIAPSLKTFPPLFLHLAKTDIFNVVQKYEYKMLMGEQPQSIDKPSQSSFISQTSSNATPLNSHTEELEHLSFKHESVSPSDECTGYLQQIKSDDNNI